MNTLLSSAARLGEHTGKTRFIMILTLVIALLFGCRWILSWGDNRPALVEVEPPPVVSEQPLLDQVIDGAADLVDGAEDALDQAQARQENMENAGYLTAGSGVKYITQAEMEDHASRLNELGESDLMNYSETLDPYAGDGRVRELRAMYLVWKAHFSRGTCQLGQELKVEIVVPMPGMQPIGKVACIGMAQPPPTTIRYFA